jgi:hypothetical protein
MPTLFVRSRFLLSFMLLSSIALFSGCFGGEDEVLEEIVSYEYSTYEGTLQSLGGAKFSSNATHLLRLEDGEIIYVYSDMINLYDSSYSGELIEAYGLVIPSNEDTTKPTLIIEHLEVLAVEDVNQDDALMTSYVSESFGLSIDYRSDWDVNETVSYILFTAPEIVEELTENDDDDASLEAEEMVEEVTEEPMDSLQLSTLANNQGLDIEEWYLQYGAAAGTDVDYIKSSVSVDLLSSIKVLGQFTTTYYVQDVELSRILVLVFTSVQDEERIEHSNLFAEMLFSLDLFSDGLREVEEAEVIVDVDADQAGEIGGTDYEEIIEDLELKLGDLVPSSGDWAPTVYDFVEPDYIYVEYEGENVKGRILIRHLGGENFERLAVFEEGSITDWELVDGVDEAKGMELVSIDVDSGGVMVVQEGYRVMESGTLNFQMQYPSQWYYSRSGDDFYFSSEPADADNALVTLMVIDTVVTTYSESTSGGVLKVKVPRNDSSSFLLEGLSEFEEQMKIMGGSLVSDL